MTTTGITGRNAILMLRAIHRLIVLLVFGGTCSFFASSVFAEDELLQSKYGYLLIQVQLSTRERVRTLAMSNVDTDHVTRIRTDSFERVGLNAWMALVAIPSGRYYWSEYEPLIGNDSAESQTNSNRHRRRPQQSANKRRRKPANDHWPVTMADEQRQRHFIDGPASDATGDRGPDLRRRFAPGFLHRGRLHPRRSGAVRWNLGEG